MKLLLSFFFAMVAYNCSGQRILDVTHYNFDLELSDRSDSIKGKAGISFTCLADTQRISIDLRQPTKGGNGFTVSSVILDKKSLSFTQSDDKVIFDLAGAGKNGAALIVTISYSGIPADGLIISKNMFGKRSFFADNWPNRAMQWIPCVDSPSDKAAVDFIVTAPEHYKVISNGLMIEDQLIGGGKRRTHYKEEVPLPTKIMVIGLADFATEQSGKVGPVPVSSWVYAENKKDGFKDYAIAVPILQWLKDYIGQFPYKKLAHVQSKTIYGGMENAGAIFYAENTVNGLADNEALIAHETAHQYFGDMVTEINFSHVWLSEGFASYMTQLFLESKYGADSLAKRMATDRQSIISFSRQKKLPVIDTVSQYMALLNTNSYQKGSWILHMLRRETGDSVFRQTIRDYYRTYAGKNASSADLQKMFEQSIKHPMDTFFHQWLRVPGQPDLEIRWSYNAESSLLQITVKQQQPDLFVFPLEIAIEAKDHTKQVIKFNINQPRQIFLLPYPAEPLAIHPDPNVSLLYSGTVIRK
ncbi:MAG: M1 family peptidase [Chitinophagaceae bacterium]|nr:MAG: M1 family peptidase [Chitinophagaceae bacterium]